MEEAGKSTAATSTSLLLVGDIHLGRRSGRVPENLRDFGVDPGAMTPAAAWRGVVDHAIALGVDGVLLAGDVVDEDNARFEAFGHLHQAVRRLLEKNIRVVAVAGNHDVEALPRLADEIAGFELLGRGGEWESTLIKEAVQIVGWSFPTKIVRENPLAADGIAPVKIRDDIPAIGLLHCDLDSSERRYAPVARRDLQRAGLRAWFLGHIHVPSDLSVDPPLGYLGSLVGLDPTETGRHGPWLLRIENGSLHLRQEPIAPLRWEIFDVPVDDHLPGDDLLGLVKRALRERHELVSADGGTEKAVGCRIRFTGETADARALRREVERSDLREIRHPFDNVLYFVDKASCAFRTRIDLSQIAVGGDPPGILARRLISLDRNDDAAADLLRQAKREMEKVSEKGVYAQLEELPLDDADLSRRLREAGRQALEELLAQHEDREADR